MEKYAHLVPVDEEQRHLSIYRVFESGERNLYACVDFPPNVFDVDRKAYERFLRLLGENLILDSPAARKLLGLRVRTEQWTTRSMRLNSPSALALAILLFAVASISGAFVFEALGFPPCELCLKERIPYYAAIPLAGLALVLAARGSSSLLRAAFAVLAVVFAGSAILGYYHAGIEWGVWPGPQECSGPLKHARSVEDFWRQLQSVKVARCDAPALRILGFSLAGWNALISAGLAALAVVGLRAKL
jgi:disulfide bond formation protein DsbB